MILIESEMVNCFSFECGALELARVDLWKINFTAKRGSAIIF
jgi:hypothetical protein